MRESRQKKDPQHIQLTRLSVHLLDDGFSPTIVNDILLSRAMTQNLDHLSIQT